MLRQFTLSVVLVLLLAGQSPAGEPTHRLRIHTQTNVVTVKVELANSPATRSKGLMHLRMMPFDHGMLFDFGRTQPVSMWMKNTYIPLDMFFIDEQGVVRGIATDTTPESLEIISSPQPVRAVLELNAGSTERFGISVGDRLEHPMFARASGNNNKY